LLLNNTTKKVKKEDRQQKNMSCGRREASVFFCHNTLRKISNYLREFFMDLKLVSILMCTWLLAVIFIMIEIGVFDNNNFVAFGPRKELSFMKVAIDTYYKYNMLILMIVVHTFITDFIADSLTPHIVNVVQDTKTKYIPHKPITYFFVTTIWAVYCSISQLFAIFIAFAQIDLMIVRMLSDIAANWVTTSLYLHSKVHDPLKFRQKQDIDMMKNFENDEDDGNDDDDDDDDDDGYSNNNNNKRQDKGNKKLRTSNNNNNNNNNMIAVNTTNNNNNNHDDNNNSSSGISGNRESNNNNNNDTEIGPIIKSHAKKIKSSISVLNHKRKKHRTKNDEDEDARSELLAEESTRANNHGMFSIIGDEDPNDDDIEKK